MGGSSLHARDRAQLVVLAYEAGLVGPGARAALGASHVGRPAPVTAIGRPRTAGAVRGSGLRPLAA